MQPNQPGSDPNVVAPAAAPVAAPTQPRRTWGLPQPGDPSRTRFPSLQLLLDARDPVTQDQPPIFIRNVKRPAQNLQFNYRNTGDKIGRGFLNPGGLPPTVAPFPLHEHMTREQIRTAGDLVHFIQNGSIQIYWPDEVTFTEDMRREIAEAIRWAKNPNQVGYTGSRDSGDIEMVPEDPRIAALAMANAPKNPRVIIMLDAFRQGTIQPDRVLHELQAMAGDLTVKDVEHIVGSIGGFTPAEQAIRSWALNLLQYLALNNRQHPGMGTPNNQAIMGAMMAAQGPQAFQQPPQYPGQVPPGYPMLQPQPGQPYPFQPNPHGHLVPPFPQAGGFPQAVPPQPFPQGGFPAGIPGMPPGAFAPVPFQPAQPPPQVNQGAGKVTVIPDQAFGPAGKAS